MGIDERRGMGENGSYEWGMLLLNRESIQHNTGERGDENPPGLRSGSSIPVHQLTHCLVEVHQSRALAVLRCAMGIPSNKVEGQLHRWSYDASSGDVFRDGKRVVVKPFFSKKRPYFVVKISDKRIPVHRLAWRLHYGRWPNNDIDHINGDSLDNRIQNLRDVTNLENCKNKLIKRSGRMPVGVKESGRNFYGEIGVNGKPLRGEIRKTVYEAVQDRIELLRKYGYTELHIEATRKSFEQWQAANTEAF